MSKAAKMLMMHREHQNAKPNGEYTHDKHKSEDHLWKESDHGEKNRNDQMQFDRETAEKWISGIKNPAGGKGCKWTYDQAEHIMQQKGYACDPAEFWAAMCMIYSDYGKTLSKYGVTSPDVFAELAYNWIDDDDVSAGENKTALYYHWIVKGK